MRRVLRQSKVRAISVSIVAIIIFSYTGNAFSENTQRNPGESSTRISNHASYLMFKERVLCQKIVEEVYWSFRIWPEQNKLPKPPLASVLTEEQIRAKVEDVLKKSNALDYYWKRPISGEQLQAEMERIARHTRRADILHHIWTSLNKDPFLIAECYVRPLLVDRLIRNWYSFDDRFHGDLKKTIQDELAHYADIRQMKSAGGSYFEMEWIKNTGRTGLINRVDENSHSQVIDSEEEWHQLNDEYSQDAFSQNKLGQLQEDENRFYIVISLFKDTNRIKIEMMEWKKVPFDQWWNTAKASINSINDMIFYTYELPSITDDICENDTWRIINQSPSPRVYHTAIWTGAEMIIWGGFNGSCLDTGGRYNPATDSWISVSLANAPAARRYHTAAWTGTEMIIWGGWNGTAYFDTGGKYNPAADSWISVSHANAPAARRYHTAAWSGTEMIIWAGFNGSYLDTGGRYNPASDLWIPTSTANAPTARYNHTGIWTGTEMIIWGGFNGSYLDTGGRYNPASDSWIPTSTANAPTARYNHTGIWTGTEMIIWGGFDGSYLDTGGKYNPASDSWISTSTANAPTARYNHTGIWTGTEMAIWGGWNGSTYFNTGGKYNPSTDSWTSIQFAPSPRDWYTTTWTGVEMIIWGGFYNGGYLNTGGRYNPAANSWVATSLTSAPTSREWHTAIWTGTEMIIWGGRGTSSQNTGGRYNPSSDLWTPTSTASAPTARYDHTTVWTGTEMVIWGGNGGTTLMTGAKYNPSSDSWTPTSTANAPTARYGHSAVWLGNEMIIWGGRYATSLFSTGGSYNPSSDSWTPISTTNAPTARYDHTAVWTGTEMIIWGGVDLSSFLNTGGKYIPASDSWIPVSLANAPIGRRYHTTVWTNYEMIIWGGSGTGGNQNTGGRYNLATDSWTATSITNAPSPTMRHSGVWTGFEMITWYGQYAGDLKTMASYCGCPIPPSSISATPASNQITVNWSLVSDVPDYNVYRRYLHCSQESEELIASHLIADTYVDSTVNPGKLYKYTVTSAGQCESAPGTWAPAQSMGDCVLQPCFSGIESISHNQCIVTIQWNAAISDCESDPLISYTLYKSTSPDFIPSPSNQIATCMHNTFYEDHEVTPGLTYYYIVRAEDSSSNGNGPCNNGNIDLNLNRASIAPIPPHITLFFDGFESGIGNWTISSNWQQSNFYAHTGIYSAVPQYDNNLQCVLMTETNAVSIPSDAMMPSLHFWTQYDIEDRADAGIIEASSDGNTWNKLPLTPDYPGFTSVSAQTCLGNNPQPAFTGDYPVWTEYAADLSAYSGTEFKARFNFATNDSVTGTGWFIDDVNIDYLGSSCAASGAPSGIVHNSVKVTKINSNPLLNWTNEDSSCTVTNYAIYRGTLPWASYNHNYLTCNVSTVPPLSYADIAAPGSYYYLVVPINNIHEGSYGTTSYGAERPQAVSACKWQNLVLCN